MQSQQLNLISINSIPEFVFSFQLQMSACTEADCVRPLYLLVCSEKDASSLKC